MPHNSRLALSEVFACNQIRLRPTYLLFGLGSTDLPTRRPLSFLVYVLIFIENKADVRTREKS